MTLFIWLAVAYVLSIACSVYGLYVDAGKKWHLVDDELIIASLFPIFNFFFGLYGLSVVYSSIRRDYMYYNEILECNSCKIYSRRGRALIASTKGKYEQCPECGKYNDFYLAGQSHKLKLENSPKLNLFDIYDIKRGKHVSYNDNIIRDQEKRRRELRKKQEQEH